MVNQESMIASVKSHCRALSDHDKEAWLALWAEDAVLEDPVGRDVFRGRKSLAEEFWASIEKLSPMKLWLERDVVVCKNEAVALLAGVVTQNGKLHRVGPTLIDHFVFDEAGKIVSMRAFWKYE